MQCTRATAFSIQYIPRTRDIVKSPKEKKNRIQHDYLFNRVVFVHRNQLNSHNNLSTLFTTTPAIDDDL